VTALPFAGRPFDAARGLSSSTFRTTRLASIREFVARCDSGELQLEFLLAAFIGSGAA
jgi:hypothetical protein